MPLRFVLALCVGLFLTACAGKLEKDPTLFYEPEDCNDLTKHDHPDYWDSCGNMVSDGDDWPE